MGGHTGVYLKPSCEALGLSIEREANMSRRFSGSYPRALRMLIGCLLLSVIQQCLLSQTESSGEDVVGRIRYLYEKRAGGPGRRIPPDAYANVVRERGRLERAQPFLATGGLVPWTSLNPTGLFYTETNANYIAGRTNVMAFHPTDAKTFYCGAAGGGVWKTTDGGVDWIPLTDNLTSLMSGAIAVDPVSPNVLYYGTGELNFSADCYYGDGVYKSTDAGASWMKLVGTNVGQYISQIAIDPTNTSVIYLSGDSAVWKSTDAGLSWARTNSSSPAMCIIVDHTNTQILYTSTSGGSVQKSTDGGASWKTLGGGLPSSEAARIQLVMAPSDHNTLYASVTRNWYDGTNGWQYGLLGLYRTTDSGLSWTLQASSPNYLGQLGWYANAVCVKPTDPNTVIVGGLDIYRSTTGGGALMQMTDWSTASSRNFAHADIHFLGYNGSVLYCGSDGGVFKSTDDGQTWSDLNATLSTLQFYSADYDPTNTLRLFGGTQDNDKENSTNGGVVWIQRMPGDGGYTVVDPVNTNFVYGQYTNGSCQRSADYGVTYAEIRPGGASGGLFLSPYKMAPGDPNTLIYGAAQVWKTTTARSATMESWTQISGSTMIFNNVSAIGISSTNSNKIYIGSDGGWLLSTADNGAHWTTVTGHNWVSDLAVDPSNDDICYATCTGFTATFHVLRTTDGGSSWLSISNNLPNIPCYTIVVVPQTPRWLFVGTDLGVFYSTDAGGSWVSYNVGLPTITIYDLKYKDATKKLMAATHGRGCYMNDLSTALPIQLASFRATSVGQNEVQLVWKTLSELNNYGFEVQKSPGVPNDYATISGSFMPGHGTTNVPYEYAWTDRGGKPGRWFYRLSQIDLDGTVVYHPGVQVEVPSPVAKENLPTEFALWQNYPNPFNPSTTIRYDLPSRSRVMLTVFNTLSQQVKILLNETQDVGYHEVRFDGAGLASGVYFYRIQAGSFVQTRKLLLLW